MLFDAKISAAYSGLTYSQRKVANYVQEKYEDVAFETLEKLAAKAGVSTTTVIRFSRALGYSGYSEGGHQKRDPDKGLAARPARTCRRSQRQRSAQ